MRLDQGVIQIASEVDISDLQIAVNNITPDKWAEWKNRQKDYPVLRNTESVGFRWCAGNGAGHGEEGKLLTYETITNYPELDEPVNRIIRLAEDIIGGTAVHAVIGKMEGNTFIKPHVDSGYKFQVSHRIHAPIITNESVIFNVNGIDYHLEAGSLYDIDNMVPHGVVNLSNERRMHLIIDIQRKQDVR